MEKRHIILARVQWVRFDFLFLWKRENSIAEIATKNRRLNNCTVSILNGPIDSQDILTEAGELFTLALYGAPTNEQLSFPFIQICNTQEQSLIKKGVALN